LPPISKLIAVSTSEALEMAMITFLIATWYVLHRMALVIVDNYGILGGVIACGVIYAIGLVMDRYDL
jgi:hypothetical protein